MAQPCYTHWSIGLGRPGLGQPIWHLYPWLLILSTILRQAQLSTLLYQMSPMKLWIGLHWLHKDLIWIRAVQDCPCLISFCEAVLIHPFSTVIAHRCPIVTRDLELLQQALAATNISKEKEPILIQGKDVDATFTPYLTKRQRKQLNKLNSYNTRFKMNLRVVEKHFFFLGTFLFSISCFFFFVPCILSFLFWGVWFWPSLLYNFSYFF